jgi:c-di-GMP-binding flagellar brake protein YcgR
MSERREHPRIDETVKLKLRDEPEGWIEEVVNISAGGVRFKTVRKFSANDVVNLDMIHNRAGLASVYLRVSGRVVRVFQIEDGYEVAVEFLDVSEDVRQALSSITSV